MSLKAIGKIYRKYAITCCESSLLICRIRCYELLPVVAKKQKNEDILRTPEIESGPPEWEPGVLPLNYVRDVRAEKVEQKIIKF